MNFNLVMPATEEQIREATVEYRAMIATREAEIKMLRTAIAHYQNQCSHPEQSNERDGPWANPCKICGESH